MSHAIKKLAYWDFVDAMDPASGNALVSLETNLAKFYSDAHEQNYWALAENKNEKWEAETHPYHCQLRDLIEEGAHIIDFGCGSAHPIENMQDRKLAGYIGIDWSKEQVQINKTKYPQFQFICGDITADHGLSHSADWAISLFALEHCTRPHVLLERMYASVKPGGKVAVICPNLSTGMNSLRSGFRATTKRQKLRNLQIVDFLVSCYEEYMLWPKRIHFLHQSHLKFPVYTKPSCLEADYYSDNDAVYLTCEETVAQHLEGLGGQIMYRSTSLQTGDISTLYLVVEKSKEAGIYPRQ